MSDALWIAGILFLVFPGRIVWRLPSIRRLDLPARLAIAFAAGIVIAATLLYLYNFAHIPWTRTTVAIPLIALSVGARVHARPAGEGARRYTSTVLILVFVALTIYGVLTARETCGDLIFFWGPKGQHFHYAGKIDAAFLGSVHNFLMHSDYPPLLPLTYAWASLVARSFSWWGALFVTPLALLATAFGFRGLAAVAIGAERAGWYAALLAAILGYGYAIGMVGGAAEPLLLLFEVIAIATLTFAGDRRDAQIVAALMLAASVFTKVEGMAFVAIVAVAYAITTRRVARAIVISIPAAILLGTWILFAWRHQLIDTYGKARGTLHFNLVGTVAGATLRQAGYGVAYVPWLATLLPLFVRRNLRPAMFPLLVAIGSIAATLFFYLHVGTPSSWSEAQAREATSWWIEASAQRVLLTPLACLVVATAAASE